MSEPTSLRLEFELDSEVYPELHALLSAMRSPQARAERLRQLASSGLVWEKVRIHGPVAMAAPEVASAPKPAPAKRSVPVAPPTPAAAVAELPRKTERRPASTKAPVGDPAPKRHASDFVDLAINADPDPAPVSQGDVRLVDGAWPSRRELEQAICELPVLLDVVAEEDVQPSLQAEPVARGEAMLVPPVGEGLPPPAADPTSADSANDGDASGLPDGAPHVVALSQKPQSRSRLMRMKERGLFKNG